MKLLQEIFLTIWNRRAFIHAAIRSHVKGQFASSRFGFAWLIIHPLAQALMFALVLSKLMAARLPGVEGTFGYALYLLAGILAWNLFSEVISASMNMFMEYANVMKKISFPRIAIPFIIAGRALLNNMLLLLAVLFVFALFGYFPQWLYLWLLPVMFVNLLLAMGIGIILGVFNVFVRDVGQVMQIVLQFWFWLTPIVYPLSAIPDGLLPLVRLNPAFHIVGWYHDILVFRTFSPGFSLLWLLMAALLVMAGAMLLFRRAGPELVDVL